MRLAVAALVVALSALLQHLATVPDRAAAEIRRPHIRNGTAALALAEDGAAHRIEEAAALALLLTRAVELIFQLLNAVVGTPKRLVLHEHGLHQRVHRIGGAAKALADNGLGLRVTRIALQRFEAVEQVEGLIEEEPVAASLPNGFVPVVEKTGLWITDIEVLRLHYAETLRNWRARFLAHRERVRTIYDERFCRMWEFYLAASEVAFRYQGHINFQMQIAKRVETVPLTRDYMFDWERQHAPKAKSKVHAA